MLKEIQLYIVAYIYLLKEIRLYIVAFVFEFNYVVDEHVEANITTEEALRMFYLTRSRGYICVRNLDFFHLVGNDIFGICIDCRSAVSISIRKVLYLKGAVHSPAHWFCS